MPTAPSSNLPPGWRVHPASSGIDLRVSGKGRKYIVLVASILAVFMAWTTATRWAASSASNLAQNLAVTALLTLFALWCAFAEELWHIEKNCLEHRVGIGAMCYRRRYQDADLQIIRRFDDAPYYRLYAMVGNKKHFLFERNLDELNLLAQFIASHSGWRIRS